MKQSNYESAQTTLPSPVMPISFLNNTPDKYSCRACNLSFAIERDLHNHLSVSTSSAKTPSKSLFNCSECTLQFTTFRGMKQHVGKIHEKKKSLPCEVCGKLFKDKYALKFHRLHVHEKSQKVECEKCSFLCYTKYVYREHIKKCGNQTTNEE